MRNKIKRILAAVMAAGMTLSVIPQSPLMRRRVTNMSIRRTYGLKQTGAQASLTSMQQ